MENRLRTLLGMKIAVIGATILVMPAIMYCYYTAHAPVPVDIPYTISQEPPYIYESRFPQGELGVLDASYFISDPLSSSGTYCLENGMLKIVSNNRYQVGFGIHWKSGFEPWLPLYWKAHIEVTFVNSRDSEVPWLVVENWITWETGKSITAMVWYQDGNLMYSYGAFPNDGASALALNKFTLPNEFNVTVDADYRARSMTVNWNNYQYNVPLQLERDGPIPKPFTHFQITLMEPGTIYVKNLKIILTNS